MTKRWADWRASMEKCRHVFNMNKQPDMEYLVCEKCGYKVKRGWLNEFEDKEE